MYGYEIVQTLIADIEPDDRVKRAMNEINAGKYFIPFIVLHQIKLAIHHLLRHKHLLVTLTN